MNKTPESKTNMIILIMLIGFLSAFFWYYLKKVIIYPYTAGITTPFHNQVNIFCDYYSIANTFFLSGFYGSYNYFPGGITLLQILKFVSFGNPYLGAKIIMLSYFSFLSFFIFKMCKKMPKQIKTLGILALVFCNYPILSTVHTANFEGFVLIILIFSYLYYLKGDISKTFMLIGVAGAIKIYPLFIFFVYLKKNNFIYAVKYTSLGFLIAFASPFIVSLIYYPEGNIIDGFNAWANNLLSGQAMEMYKNTMIIGYNGVFFGHSLLNSIRLLMTPNESFMISFMTEYYSYILFLSTFLILMSCLISLKIKSLIYRYIFILSALCLFRPTSSDYYLIQFLIPFVALMLCKKNYIFDMKILIAVCLLFLSKNYYIFYDNNYITSNTILNTILLLFIYFIIVLNPKSREEEKVLND
tara:strand:- start:444 stop:1682 length:1239 start_codon:yes stop_codon:yes gene_type:complete